MEQSREGREYRLTNTQGVEGIARVGDVCVMIYDDHTDRPKFWVNGYELWLYMSQLEPVQGSFDPVPWFCGALLVAYFVVEYIGGGIGI